LVTLKDISKECGVSLATVSKALNNASDISEATASIVKAKAKEMGYIPNSTARALKMNKSHNIGVLFVDTTSSGLTHEYFSTILNSLKDEVEKNGYDITFINKGIGHLDMNYYEHAKYRQCDGVIVASVDFKDPDVIQLIESEIPTVTLDYIFNNRTAVMSDNDIGLGKIVEYVYSMGHRDIALIHGENTAVTQKRLASFYHACFELGLEIPDENVLLADYHNPKESALATRKLLKLKKRPTCIIYPDDYSFIGGKNELEAQGLKICQDISVVGYDGIYLSQILRPKLTTYKQNAEAMGRQSAKELIKLIEKPKSTLPSIINVCGEMLHGDTVKNLNEKGE